MQEGRTMQVDGPHDHTIDSSGAYKAGCNQGTRRTRDRATCTYSTPPCLHSADVHSVAWRPKASSDTARTALFCRIAFIAGAIEWFRSSTDIIIGAEKRAHIPAIGTTTVHGTWHTIITHNLIRTGTCAWPKRGVTPVLNRSTNRTTDHSAPLQHTVAH